MYARLVLFTLGPGTRSTADTLMNQFGTALKNQKGFIKGHFIGDDETGQYGSFVVWESRKDGEAAAEDLFPKMQESLKSLAEEQPQFPLFEVLGVIEVDK